MNTVNVSHTVCVCVCVCVCVVHAVAKRTVQFIHSEAGLPV
jgi:hypothetical protein